MQRVTAPKNLRTHSEESHHDLEIGLSSKVLQGKLKY